jgi:PAS domain S-box-containing protein
MDQSCPAPCRSILDHIADGVVTMDLEGLIFWFNKAAEQITGYSKDEALGRSCYEIFNSDRCEGDDCPRRKTINTGDNIVDLELHIRTKDERDIPISVSTAPIRDADGRVFGVVQTLRDLSHLKLFQRDFYERYSHQNIITQNNQMILILRTLRDIASTDSTVLLQGESGTGKELLSLAIHNLGPRQQKPYVTVNCGAIPDTLLESELFGYTQGAFTDANSDKPGRFALADGGTIFLDEIGDLSLQVQSKLLRVLENGDYQPLGSTKTMTADSRVISATNKDLSRMVREGRFREDLYYRLNVVRIQIPSLRDRRDDIPLLIRHFIGKFNGRTGKSIRSLSREAMEQLLAYEYPGNIRELENLIQYAFILAKGKTIQTEHLPPYIWQPQPVQIQWEAHKWNPREEEERDTFVSALQENRWHKGEAARALGISRATLWRRMKKYHLL